MQWKHSKMQCFAYARMEVTMFIEVVLNVMMCACASPRNSKVSFAPAHT